MLPDNLAEEARRLDGLKTAIEFYGGLDAAVPQKPADGFVFTGPVLQIDGRRSVARKRVQAVSAGRAGDSPVTRAVAQPLLKLGRRRMAQV